MLKTFCPKRKQCLTLSGSKAYTLARFISISTPAPTSLMNFGACLDSIFASSRLSLPSLRKTEQKTMEVW